MARITVSDIDDYWENDVAQTTKQRSLDMATRVVDREVQGESSVTTDDEELLELLLAVHFAKTEQPDLQSMADSAFVHPPDLNGLRETREGRRAIIMDPTGNLAMSAKPAAKLRSFGPTHDS